MSNNSVFIGPDAWNTGSKLYIDNEHDDTSLKLQNSKNTGTDPNYGIYNIVNNDSRGNLYGYFSEVYQNEDATTNNYTKALNL